jgi:hypothetical protein
MHVLYTVNCQNRVYLLKFSQTIILIGLMFHSEYVIAIKCDAKTESVDKCRDVKFSWTALVNLVPSPSNKNQNDVFDDGIFFMLLFFFLQY